MQRNMVEIKDKKHHPNTVSDKLAKGICVSLRWLIDILFQKRYGHRAVMLETIAGVPGMVGAMLIHLRCLRTQSPDYGWIKQLLDEAENERMHLMVFIEIAKPNWLERLFIILSQIIFFFSYSLLYLLSSSTAHRLIGYFEEEAVRSYSHYLKDIDEERIENIPAPKIAIEYWNLDKNAKLREVVVATQKDEAFHRDTNHHFSDILSKK